MDCFRRMTKRQGQRDEPGVEFQQAEAAKFWLTVVTELEQHGVQDALICCVTGLEGSPGAIEPIFPNAWMQTFTMHLMRESCASSPTSAAARSLTTSNRSLPSLTPTRPQASRPAGASAIQDPCAAPSDPQEDQTRGRLPNSRTSPGS
jgi:Transposase, Mutator family